MIDHRSTLYLVFQSIQCDTGIQDIVFLVELVYSCMTADRSAFCISVESDSIKGTPLFVRQTRSTHNILYAAWNWHTIGCNAGLLWCVWHGCCYVIKSPKGGGQDDNSNKGQNNDEQR